MLENRFPGELELQVSSTDKPEQADKFILTPSQEEKEKESTKLTLEAESIAKVSEITFDGETESEARIEEAMKEYNVAMNKAAGIE
jgi:hypothetical protein